jgi:hypothetical protein
MKIFTAAFLLFSLGTVSASAQFQNTASANRPTPPSGNSPIPIPLLTGKTVFISNAGGASGLFPEPFTGGPDRGYAQFYAAIKSWGKYTLVDDPAKADLIFQIQLVAPVGAARGSKQYGASDPLPEFNLVIFQGSTHYILWALTESIDVALLQKTHDRNFDLALGTLVSDLKQVVLRPVPPGS